MNTDLSELAKRAIACPKWRWTDGMKAVGRKGQILAWFRLEESQKQLMGDWSEALPDLSDFATVGCLLMLVRDAHNAPHAWVEARYGQKFRVVSPEGYSEATRMLCEWQVGTEAAALVAALEAAP